MINKLQKTASYIVPCILLMVLVLYHIEDNNMPKIFGDEYGYWAAGSYFSGLDWKDITSLNDYYGWGYGLFLSAILRLPISAEECYRIAIGINGVFVCAIYVIALKLTKEIIPCKYDFINVVVAFSATIMPSTLYYTQYTMSEVILALCYWSIVYLAWEITKNYRLLYEILFIVINAFMLSVHLRAIGIVLVSVLFLIMIHIKKGKNELKRLIISMLFLLALLVLISGVKGIYRNAVSNPYIELRLGNDISGQMGKLHFFFTVEGLSSFLKLFVGRLYAMTVNSFLLAACVGTYCIGCVIYWIKTRKCFPANNLISCFVTLCTLSEVAISALSMMGAHQGRFDILTYSRYHEFTIGVLILVGLKYGIEILNQKEKIKYALVSCIFTFLLAFIVNVVQEYETPLSHNFISNPFTFYWVTHAQSIKETFFLAVLCAVLLYLAYIFISWLLNNTVGTAFMCCTMIVFTIFSSNYIYIDGCLNWSVQETEDYRSLEKYIIENDYEKSLYFPVDDDVLYVDGLQFLLKDESIHIINMQEMEQFNDEIIVTSIKYDDSILVQSGFKKIFETGRLNLWRISGDNNQ